MLYEVMVGHPSVFGKAKRNESTFKKLGKKNWFIINVHELSRTSIKQVLLGILFSKRQKSHPFFDVRSQSKLPHQENCADPHLCGKLMQIQRIHISILLYNLHKSCCEKIWRMHQKDVICKYFAKFHDASWNSPENLGPLDSSLRALQVPVAPPIDENRGKTASVFQQNKSHKESQESQDLHGLFLLK